MNSVKQTSRNRIYAFAGYQSMRSALPYMQRVALARNLTDIHEEEARKFVQRIPGKGFRNYLESPGNYNSPATGIASLITALQLLYKSNGFSARYIVIAQE